MKAPTTEAEALAHLADDLRVSRHLAVAALVDAGHRALAPTALEELTLRAAHPVTVAMVRAWSVGNAAAVLAGYTALYAPETDSDEAVALAAMAAVPAPTHDVAVLGRDADRAVVEHLVRRMRESADVHYLFGYGTRSFELLVPAVAAAEGLSPAEATDRLLECDDDRDADVVTLRDRVETLEQLLDERSAGWRDDPEPQQRGLFGSGR